jgi:DNA-binding MarR family transcriptional regulator
MQSNGYSTPSTHTLSISGDIERSDATIKRYIAALIGFGLIAREFPNGRKHLFRVTELGQKMYDSRKQNPTLVKAKIKAQNKIELLNKTINPSINNNNYNYLDSEQPHHKPVFKKIDLMILRGMLKKCTDSLYKADKLENEIRWAIECGSLMCRPGGTKYHFIHNSVQIAIYLVKSGRWRTPIDFNNCSNNEHDEVSMKKVEPVELMKCTVCSDETECAKRIVLNTGPRVICSKCYCKNLNLEFGESKKKVWDHMRLEYKHWRDEPFNYSRFNAFKKNKIRFNEPTEEEPKDDRIVMDFNEMNAHIKVEGVVENYFKFQRQEVKL